MLLVPKRQGVEETSRFGVLKLHHARLAAVGCLVDARIAARTGAEQVGGVRPESLPIPEVQLLCPGHLPGGPCLSPVRGPAEGPLGSADPRNLGTDSGQPSEVGVRVDGLRLPLSMAD